MIEKLLALFKSNEKYELETRFGSYDKNGFHPKINKDDFEVLMSFFKSYNLETTTSKFSENNYAGNIRERIYESGKKEIYSKRRISILDDKELDCRIAVSLESPVDDISDLTPLSVIEKERTSFYLKPCFRLDFTITNSEKYDIELECVDKKAPVEVLLKGLTKHTMFLVKFLRKTNFLLNKTEQKNILNDFQKRHVRFNNCKNIKKDDFKMDLVFTEKTDGERNYLFINKLGEVYLINNTKNVRKAGINFGKKLYNTIFDTECVYDIKKGLVINVFDIMMLNEKYVEEKLNERLEIIKGIIQNGNEKIKLKQYFNSQKDLEYLVKKNATDKSLDGIIFSTTQESYKKTTHLKWKPVQTVDLKFYQGSLFAYDKKGLDVKAYDWSKNTFKEGKVLEFKVDKNGELSFFRERNDKYRGNFIDCVHDIINDAKNNISGKALAGLYKNDVKKNYEFRKFHNYIKKTLYEKYLNENDRLVELACGKGGDLHKWNCSYVLGVDNNKKFLQNARHRNEKIGKRCDFEYLDLANDVISNEYPELLGNKFDVCSIQFAIHYLFESEEKFENLMRNINSALKSGGYLIGTCMDEKTIRNTNNNLFSLEIGEDKPGVFGNEVSVNFNDEGASSDGILRGGNKEYIVKDLKCIMENKGFELVEMKNFSKYFSQYKSNLSQDEKLFSSMNTTFVFLKK